MKLQVESAQNTAYDFELLELRRVKHCFDEGGSTGLRDLAEKLRSDADALVRLADAIDSGESYYLGPASVCTWWGWG